MKTPRPRILIIDDTPANLHTLAAALVADFELQIVTSGAKGIARALEQPPALIVLDVMMPEMDGFATCRRLQAEPSLRDIPVVFVTALHGAESEMQALRQGAADYISKPIDVAIARQRIRNILEREALRQALRDKQAVLEGEIAERRRVENDLRIAASAFEAQVGIIVTDARGVIVRVNRALTEETGYAADELVGQLPWRFDADPQAADYAAIGERLLAAGVWQGEIRERHKNGEIHPKWMNVTAIRGDDGRVTHYVGTQADITERKAAEEEIRNLAFYDSLTRLPNRRLLLERLRLALASCARNRRYGAVFFIDLDNFKTLNDTRGHDQGDLLLQQVAQRLTGCVREGDTVARLGGDEFVVMLEELDQEINQAAALAEMIGEKILGALNRSYWLNGSEVHSTPSIGITLFGSDHEVLDELLKQADMAMYQAKTAGRNTLRFFDPARQEAVNARIALEQELRDALRDGQFVLYYQPQVEPAAQISGAEALVRWQHPQRGPVAPDAFIPLAEETGLILPLGQWVLEHACRQLTAWAAQPALAHLTLAVNVSARQLRQPDFVAQVRGVLERTGADPRKLKLELTESQLMENVENTIAKMSALKALGVSFALDDFGTGYSSLAYLKRLPVETLKIDRSFVRDIMIDANDAVIARTIITLARSLSLAVIAEGVETVEQRDFLADNGCHTYQGYLFSRPLPLAAFEALVSRHAGDSDADAEAPPTGIFAAWRRRWLAPAVIQETRFDPGS